MKAVKIRGEIRNYPWGTEDFIPSIVGGYDGNKQAELWLGTHPRGPSITDEGISLSDLIGGRLPILMKIISINEPLSVQCHPDEENAKRGFNEGNVNYTDPNQKSEILYALTPITLLSGFREEGEIRKDLENAAPRSFMKYLSGKESTKDIFFTLLSLSGDEKKQFLEEADESVSSNSIFRLFRKLHPDDIMALSAFMMNRVHLDGGSAIYHRPGIMHSYISGNGIELMDASDNVLRAGLTVKRIDPDEMRKVAVFESTEPDILTRKSKYGMDEYGTESFSLLVAETGTYALSGGKNRIILNLSGRAIINGMVLNGGEAAFTSDPFDLIVEGRVFISESNR